jgi:hypothetical protein
MTGIKNEHFENYISLNCRKGSVEEGMVEVGRTG